MHTCNSNCDRRNCKTYRNAVDNKGDCLSAFLFLISLCLFAACGEDSRNYVPSDITKDTVIDNFYEGNAMTDNIRSVTHKELIKN